MGNLCSCCFKGSPRADLASPTSSPSDDSLPHPRRADLVTRPPSDHHPHPPHSDDDQGEDTKIVRKPRHDDHDQTDLDRDHHDDHDQKAKLPVANDHDNVISSREAAKIFKGSVLVTEYGVAPGHQKRKDHY